MCVLLFNYHLVAPTTIACLLVHLRLETEDAFRVLDASHLRYLLTISRASFTLDIKRPLFPSPLLYYFSSLCSYPITVTCRVDVLCETQHVGEREQLVTLDEGDTSSHPRRVNRTSNECWRQENCLGLFSLRSLE